MSQAYDPVTPQPSKTVACETFARMLANVPGIVGVECHTGKVTGTDWIDILLPGNRTMRIKATRTGGLLFTVNFETGEG